VRLIKRRIGLETAGFLGRGGSAAKIFQRVIIPMEAGNRGVARDRARKTHEQEILSKRVDKEEDGQNMGGSVEALPVIRVSP